MNAVNVKENKSRRSHLEVTESFLSDSEWSSEDAKNSEFVDSCSSSDSRSEKEKLPKQKITTKVKNKVASILRTLTKRGNGPRFSTIAFHSDPKSHVPSKSQNTSISKPK